MLQLADTDFKIIMLNMLKNLEKNMAKDGWFQHSNKNIKTNF